MATLFKNKVVKNVGTVPIEIYASGASARATVIGLSLTNLTPSFVYVSVLIADDTSQEGYYCKDVLVPANTSLRLVNQGEKLILPENNAISVVASTNDSIDVVMSYVEIV